MRTSRASGDSESDKTRQQAHVIRHIANAATEAAYREIAFRADGLRAEQRKTES